jgi:5'-3' exonuclease
MAANDSPRPRAAGAGVEQGDLFVSVAPGGRAAHRRPLMLVDGSSLLYRAYFGVPNTMRAPNGHANNALRGFLDSLARLVDLRRPRALAVATDRDWRPQWRVEAVPSYKTHRLDLEPQPDLDRQIEAFDEVMAAAGIPAIGADGFEAEDIIATLAAPAPPPVEIVTGDRDLFALVRDPDVRVLYLQRGDPQVVDEAFIEAKYGIPGRLYGDFALLRGDPSDGLPGVSGVGEKRAAQLVRQHGGIPGLITAGVLAPPAVAYLETVSRVMLPSAEVPLEEIDLDRPPQMEEAAAKTLAEAWGIVSPMGRLRAALQRARVSGSN